VTPDRATFSSPFHVVVADANVLYSRVLRDYLLYAANQEIVNVVWSSQILGEVLEHLMENVPGFDRSGADRLAAVLDRAYPASAVEPGPADYDRLAAFGLPDEGDRHVIATALAAGATTICTNDKTGFPADVLGAFGIGAISADRLLGRLVRDHPSEMLAAHRAAVLSLKNATDESTLEALRLAGAPETAAAMKPILATVRASRLPR
jgi:predicted nucleic acid-binding protein